MTEHTNYTIIWNLEPRHWKGKVMSAVMFNPIYKHLSEVIFKAINEMTSEHGLKIEDVYSQLGSAPNLKMGHIAFPCFPLAKALRNAPPKIAGELENFISNDEIISQAKAVGPYLNFFLSPNGVGKNLIEPINKGEIFSKDLMGTKDRWMVEYSQPNTHKEMHVGHMRNLCLGNALIRMARYAGVDVLAVTYPGDVGTHVAKCLWYMKKYNKEEVPSENKGAWLGRMYSTANNLLEDEKGTPKEDQNRKELTDILHQLHDQKGEYYELWQETRQWSIDLMQETYQWADVEFDRWFWESEVDAASLTYAKELQEKGHLILDDGAIGMDLSEDKLGFCILIKTDGTGLYSTKDVELARKKFEEFGVDKNIYIVDNRQAHHFKQVFKVLEKVGFEKAKDCFHLQYAMVELTDGAMSSRKGNIVPLMQLISQMQETIKTNYLQKYLDNPESGWTVEEVDKVAQMVANGAIKYGMIRVDNNRKIVFDMNEWLKLDGETGPYLQYVHARIASLCDKLDYNPSNPVDWSSLEKEQEIALSLKLIEFNNVVANCVEKMQTIHICSYLYELGRLFNSFYSECPIGKAENETLKNTRMSLAHATGAIMNKGLEIIGIPAPQRM